MNPYTSKLEDGQKMESPSAEIDGTTKFLAKNGAKTTIQMLRKKSLMHLLES
jgi:hypothetical protein